MTNLIPTSDFFLQILLAFVPVLVFLFLLGSVIWLLDRSRLSTQLKDTLVRWSLSVIAGLVVGLGVFVIWLVWPDIRAPAQTVRPTQVTNAQQLATLVFSQYDTGKPICLIPLTNHSNTYLLLFSGTELKAPTQASHITSDILAALGSSVFDFYHSSVKQALQNFRKPNGDGLSGVNIIMAGHSLGGMEAENLAADVTVASRYNIVRLITFGKPKTSKPFSEARVARHFLLTGDPVVKWVDRFLFFVPKQSPGTVILPPTGNSSQSEHSNYPVSGALKGYDAMGDPVVPGQTGNVLLLDLSNSACFRADNPKIYCTPQVHTYGYNPA